MESNKNRQKNLKNLIYLEREVVNDNINKKISCLYDFDSFEIE